MHYPTTFRTPVVDEPTRLPARLGARPRINRAAARAGAQTNAKAAASEPRFDGFVARWWPTTAGR